MFRISYIKSLIQGRIGHVTPAAAVIIIYTVSIFMPFVLTPAALVAVTVCFFTDKSSIAAFRRVRCRPLIIALFALLLIVPAAYGNWLGLACGAVICMLLLSSVFMRIHMTRPLFELLLDIACAASLIGVAVSYIEKISAFLLYGSTGHRPFSIYINANYFATVTVFVMLACVYKLASARGGRGFYAAVFALNFISLYLTNCRSAFIPLFVGALIILAVNKRFKLFFVLLGASLALIVLAFCVKGLFPRLDDLGGRTYSVRKAIWDTAVSAIRDKPLFGRGPLSYMFVHDSYGAPLQLHAHSIYFELPMSLGFVGTALLLVYFGGIIADAARDVRRRAADAAGLSLITATVAAVLIHGITDCTLIGAHTPLLFLLLLAVPTSRLGGEDALKLSIGK